MVAPVILVEAQPRNAADGSAVPLRLAGLGGLYPYFYGEQHYRAGIAGLPRTIASLDFDGEQLGGGGVPQAMELRWSPAGRALLAEAAALYWADAPITVRIGPEGTDLPPIATAGLVLDAPVEGNAVRITLSDAAADLKKALLTDRFAGTGGIEGPVELEGIIKSRAWGRCFNVPGQLIDRGANVWCFGDPRRAWQRFVQVRDRGVALTVVQLLAWQGSAEATFAALKGAAVADGGVIVCPSIACVKLWTQATGDLKADIEGETAGGYVETAPEIVARLVAVRSAIPIAAGALADAVAWRPAPTGWRIDNDTTTTADAISELLGDVSLSWLLIGGQLRFRRWEWTASTRVARSHRVTRRSTVKPVGTRKLGYRRNWSPMARGDLAAIVLAQDVAYDDGTPVESLKPAQPGADVTGQNTSADTKAVAGRPATEVIAQLDRIEPISSDTADLKEAQKDLDEAVDRLRQSDDAAVVALAALRGVVLDGAATQRQLQRAEGKLAAATMQLLLMSDSADARMRDAGFITDPATGKVYAYALDRLGDRQTKVEATLDAQAGQIALRATSAEVDDKILKAVLNPEQVAQLEPLIARIAAVEVVYDALKAEVQTKAELVELTKAVVRITNAEQRISAAEGLISTKVEQTSFDQAMTRIGAAEQLLQSYGDVSRYGIELRQDRAAQRQSDQALLASILGEHQADELRLTAQALLRQELYTKIVDDVDGVKLIEARARTELAIRLSDLDARSVQDRLLAIEGDRLLGQDIDALGVQTAQQSAEIATLKTASLAAGVGIAGVEQSIRQQVRSQSQADAALLGGVLATDKAEERYITSLAEIHSQLRTTLIAGFQAEAVARQGLRARIDSADARFDQEARSTADRIRAVTTLITSLGARFDDPATGLAATRADLSRLERATSEGAQATAEAIAAMRAIVNDPITGLEATRADLSQLTRVTAAASQANAEAIGRLEGVVTDPATGLEKTRAALTLLSDLVATQNTVAVRRLDTLEGTVNDPSTGLPWARGAIADLARVTTSRDDAAAESIRQVRAYLDGIGSVGLQQAFEALVTRTGKLEGRYTLAIDTDGRLQGFVLAGSQNGPASFSLIDTDFLMGKGKIVFNTGTYMKVQGVGFGAAKDLIEWYGPTMAIDQCSRANALEYRTTTGDAYYGGSLSAGVLRNPGQSSSLAADAVAEVPSFGSNGKPVKYIASWSYYREWTAQYPGTADGLKSFNAAVASFGATSDDGGYTYFGAKDVEQASSSITLTRSFGAAYEQLQQRSFTTQQQTFFGLKPVTSGEPGNARFTASIGGGFTVLDPTQSTANRTLRLTLARGFTLPDGVIQRLTIVAIEE